MKNITGKFLKSIAEGSLVRVRWPDASADACEIIFLLSTTAMVYGLVYRKRMWC
mgnify:CR=1 FL=1